MLEFYRTIEPYLAALGLTTLSAVVVLGVLFRAAKWFGERWVLSKFDQRLEAFKHSQRREIEQLRQELKSRDLQIASLRDLALGALDKRTEILTERRIQAAEVIWASVVEYSRYRQLVESTQTLKMSDALDTAAEATPEAEKVRAFAANLIDLFGVEKFKFEARPAQEEIFVSAAVWARFKLYRSVMTLPLSKLLAMRGGMKRSFIKDQKPLLVAAKSVLPHMSSFVDEHGEEGLSYLNDLFEEEVKKAIIESFSDPTSDAETVKQAALIIENVNKADVDLRATPTISVPGLVNEPTPAEPNSIEPKGQATRSRRFSKYISKDGS